MDLSSYLIILHFIGAFCGCQQFEVPPGRFHRRRESLTNLSSEYSRNKLASSTRVSDTDSSIVKLSNFPTLSPKDIVFPRNLFAQRKLTGAPKITSTESKRLEARPAKHHMVIPESYMRKTHPANTPKTRSTKTQKRSPTSTQKSPLISIIPVEKTTISTQMFSSINNTTVAYSTVITPRTSSTTTPENFIISYTHTTKPLEDQDDISRTEGNINTFNEFTEIWYSTNSSNPLRESLDYETLTTDLSEMYSTTKTTTFNTSIPTTTSSASTTPSTAKSQPLHSTSSPTPEIASTASSLSPKFSFALTPLKVRISNLMKNSVQPLVAIGKKFYHLQTDIKVNFLGAFNFCRKYGMELLSIESQEEEDAITNLLNESKITEIWTSGTDLAEEGKFVWLSTGKTFDYIAWGPTQPDNFGAIEDCVQIVLRPLFSDTFSWEDVFCDLPSYFICEVASCTDFCMNDS